MDGFKSLISNIPMVAKVIAGVILGAHGLAFFIWIRMLGREINSSNKKEKQQ